jgi:hypothetical protein
VDNKGIRGSMGINHRITDTINQKNLDELRTPTNGTMEKKALLPQKEISPRTIVTHAGPMATQRINAWLLVRSYIFWTG